MVSQQPSCLAWPQRPIAHHAAMIKGEASLIHANIELASSLSSNSTVMHGLDTSLNFLKIASSAIKHLEKAVNTSLE